MLAKFYPLFGTIITVPLVFASNPTIKSLLFPSTSKSRSKRNLKGFYDTDMISRHHNYPFFLPIFHGQEFSEPIHGSPDFSLNVIKCNIGA